MALPLLSKRFSLAAARSALAFSKNKPPGILSSHRGYCTKTSVKNDLPEAQKKVIAAARDSEMKFAQMSANLEKKLSEMRKKAFDDILKNNKLPEAQKKVIAAARDSEMKFAQMSANLEKKLDDAEKKFVDDLDQIISNRKRFITLGLPVVFATSVAITVLFPLEREKLEARRAKK